MRLPVAARAVVARGAHRGMRRAVVAGAREQLREQDREHDVAGGLGVRAAPGGGAQGEGEERAQLACGARLVPAVRLRGGLPQPRVAPGM